MSENLLISFTLPYPTNMVLIFMGGSVFELKSNNIISKKTFDCVELNILQSSKNEVK